MKVPDNGVGFCLRSRLPHCRGQWCSHLTVGGSHCEIPVAVLRRAFYPGRRWSFLFFTWRGFRSDLGYSLCVMEFRWVHGYSREVRGRQNSLVTTCFTPWLLQSLRGTSNQSSFRARSLLWTAGLCVAHRGGKSCHDRVRPKSACFAGFSGQCDAPPVIFRWTGLMWRTYPSDHVMIRVNVVCCRVL